MQILICCQLPESALSELRALGTHVIYEPDCPSNEIEQRVADAAILVVGRRRVPPSAVTSAARLQMIVRAGTSTQNIAVQEASAHGIFVCNCPRKDAVAIAELFVGLLIALDRRLLPCSRQLAEGNLDEPLDIDAKGLHGRTLGLLGFERVGEELAARARALGMRVRAWGASLTPEQAAAAGVEYCLWPSELAASSDMLAAFLPGLESQEQKINAEILDNMRPGAYLAFIGHPSCIDEDALVRAAEEKRLRVGYDLYAVDLASSRTARVQRKLHSIADVIGTHYLAGRTQQSWDATAAEVVQVVRQFLVAGEVMNCVNLLERSPATWQLVLRLRDAVGVMAAIMEHVRADGINAEEITTRVFSGAHAAWSVIALDERPSTEALEAIGNLEGVLHLELRALV